MCPLHDFASTLVVRLVEDLSELVGCPLNVLIISGYQEKREIGPHIDITEFAHWVIVLGLGFDVMIRFSHARHGKCPA